MRKLIAILAIATVGIVPSAAHAHGDEADAVIPASQVPDGAQRGDIYVDVETKTLWQETNGDEGLQTQPHMHGEDVIPPDTDMLATLNAIVSI